MKQGNWIALDKNLSKHFPDREFSKIEAAYSLTLDYDNNKLATISGYASLWGWSRSKVRNFLEEMGVIIEYPCDTSKKQKQKGQIKKQKEDRTGTEKGQIRMVDTKVSQDVKDRKRTEEGQKKDRSENTTSNTINKPNTKKEYSEDSKEFRLSLLMFDKIISQDPKNKHALKAKADDFQKWCEDINKINRLDERTFEQIEYVVKWVYNDPFWCSKILGASKLREKFSDLVAEVKRKKNNNQNGNSQPSTRYQELD